MLSYDEALAAILEHTPALPVEQVPIDAALGLFTAEEVTAPFDMPRFDNSAMDGFGVRVMDVANASPGNPVRLRVADTVQAGDNRALNLAQDSAVKIMTGAPIPEGVEAVIMRENCDEADSSVAVRRGGKSGENIRRRGEEFAEGQIIIVPGMRITPAVIGLLASLGKAAAAVHRQPKVSIVGTGNELTPPGQPLSPGGLYDSNSYALSAAARTAGAEVTHVLRAKDEMEQVTSALKAAAEEADIVVAVGGVSIGDYDLVKQALLDMGVEERFWRVAIKPGKPLFFGTRGNQLYFGLPGNPVSALVCFHLFVRTALRKMMGANEPEPHWLSAKLDGDLRKKAGRLEFVRGFVETIGGELVVRPTRGQDSHMLGGLANANCLIVFPSDQETLNSGDAIEVCMLEWS